MVHGRMAPLVVCFRTRGVTRLTIGGTRVGKPIIPFSAELQHLVHSRQVFALLDGAFRTGHHFFGRKAGQGFQPQSLGVVQGLHIRERRIELVVVAQL